MSNNYFIKYFLVQIKRVLHRFPAVFSGTLLLVGSLALVLLAMVDNANSGEKQTMVEVGVAGDVDNDYVDMAMVALRSMDESRFAVNLEIMEEKEARERLLEGKLSAYFVIPEGLVEAIMYGKDFKIKYYTCKGQAGLGTVLINEFSDVLYRLLTKSQNGIYGMQDLCKEYGVSDEVFWQGTEDLNITYITFLLERQNVFEIEELGISNQLSMTGYYICSFVIVFFMLFGLNGCALFINQDVALKKLLASQGCSSFVQVISEFLSYSLLLIVSALGILSAVGVVCDANYIRTDEWNFVDFFTVGRFGIQLIPVMCMFTAMAMLGHELAGNMVSGLLLQFLLTVGLGYMSGCFYPSSFFPEAIQIMGGILPSGVALDYASKCMLGKMGWQEILMVMLYSILFLTLTCLFRKREVAYGWHALRGKKNGQNI